MNSNNDLDFKRTMRQMLVQPARDADGKQIMRNGHDLTWHEALCDQILKKGFKDGGLGWKILQEADVVSRGEREQNADDRHVAIVKYEQDLQKQTDKIRQLLKLAGTDDPALELQIELAARDWLAYEKSCQDYASAINFADYDEQIRLSDQMRKWSATVRDDLTKLTMNVKDSGRAMESNPPLSAFMESVQ